MCVQSLHNASVSALNSYVGHVNNRREKYELSGFVLLIYIA